MTKPNWTTDQIVAKLNSGSLWPAGTVTFSFPTVASSENADIADIETFEPLVAAQVAGVKLALAAYAEIINVEFLETPGTDGNGGDIRFLSLLHTAPAGWFSGLGSSPGPGRGGDVYFNRDDAPMVHPIRGEKGHWVYLHEIGHAMGLSHPGDYNGVDNPTYANDAKFRQDSEQYTVMSPFGAEETGGDFFHPDGVWQSPETLMLYDIAALQAMYGANTTTRVGHTTYGFHSNIAGDTPYDFAKNFDPVLCIYDAGGQDTLDFSGFTSRTRLDLHDGAFSDTPGMAHNVSIAFGTVIENGIGGSAGDVIVGNSAANTLEGRRGNDRVSGDAGNDKLWGGTGNDTLAGGLGRDVLRGDAGRDRYVFNTTLDVANVDIIQGFSGSGDKICLDDSIFTRLGTWSSGRFHASTSGVAHDRSDRIIYETDTGKVFYDADGNKAGGSAAILFAKLSGHPGLDWLDFTVV